MVVYGHRIIQGNITRDSRVVVDIVTDGRASRPYDDRIGKRVTRSHPMGEVQGIRTVWRRTIIPLVDLWAPQSLAKAFSSNDAPAFIIPCGLTRLGRDGCERDFDN